MKRLLKNLGILVASVGMVSVSLADTVGNESDRLGGAVVRWDRIEGTIVLPDGSGMKVGPLEGSARYRVGGGGSAVLFMDRGYLRFQIQGLSWGLNYNNGPLGMGLGSTYIGTVVCDSTERYAGATWVDTEEIALTDGHGSFSGLIDLPQACRDRPEELVFLLRHGPSSPFYGAFVAYGAGRRIRDGAGN